VRFVLLDETIVSHGYWVKISGGDLTQFKRNPIMLWMHQRASGYDGKNQILPIGYWKDIKVEQINGIKSITAEPVFDEKDEFALQIKSKVDSGVIKMASAGLAPFSWSDAPEDLKPGQTRATITKWEMKEASIVDLGANKNAIRLYDEDNEINLSESSNNNFIPKLNFKQDYNMKSIALKLGLNENSTDEEILSAIEKLQTSEEEKTQKLKELHSERTEALMQHECINEENREHFEKLAEINFALAKKTLDLMSKKELKEQPEGERISELLKQENSSGNDSVKSWNDYSDEEKEELRQNSPDIYCELFEAEFGYYPNLD